MSGYPSPGEKQAILRARGYLPNAEDIAARRRFVERVTARRRHKAASGDFEGAESLRAREIHLYLGAGIEPPEDLRFGMVSVDREVPTNPITGDRVPVCGGYFRAFYEIPWPATLDEAVDSLVEQGIPLPQARAILGIPKPDPHA